MNISNEGFLEMMTADSAGTTKEDVRLPEGELGEQIKTRFENGDELIVTVIAAMGEEAVVAYRNAVEKKWTVRFLRAANRTQIFAGIRNFRSSHRIVSPTHCSIHLRTLIDAPSSGSFLLLIRSYLRFANTDSQSHNDYVWTSSILQMYWIESSWLTCLYLFSAIAFASLASCFVCKFHAVLRLIPSLISRRPSLGLKLQSSGHSFAPVWIAVC